MKEPARFGDGDLCPQEPMHGYMWFHGNRQRCPHSAHRGNAWYARDGITPAPRTPAGPSSPAGAGAAR